MKVLLGVRVEPELKVLLQKLADSENRNLSNFVVNAVVTYLRDHKGIEDWRAEVKDSLSDDKKKA
jgi:uncharacterized protein (DUF1778 family)